MANRVQPPSHSALERLIDRALPVIGGLVAITLGLVVLVFLVRQVQQADGLSNRLPDFAAIEDTNVRKAEFFAFLDPFVAQANAEIQADRTRLNDLRERASRREALPRRDAEWLAELAEAYEVPLADPTQPDERLWLALERRVDVIPPSLALAQAALESGWGTSRFAQEGNNLFGMWCYTPGCGIVPARRPAGQTYEVTRYRSPGASFAAYIRNLNTNTAYRELRQLRRQQRADGQTPTGLVLAGGLIRYSQEGSAYIEKVRRMIRSNDLAERDAI